MSDWPQPGKGIVLSVGAIPELLNLRAEVLRCAGFDVFSTTIPQQAGFRMGTGHYDVLLLCYSLSDDWQKRLIEHFREVYPSGRVIAISDVPHARSPEAADQHVYGVAGAEALINAIRGKAA